MSVAVVGIGNVLLGDDGAGVHVIKALKDGYCDSEEVVLIDGGTMGLDLLPFIEGSDGLLIVDAVNAGKDPGTIVSIEGQNVPAYLAEKISVHQIGVPDLLFSAKLLGVLPKDLCLIGVQPKVIEVGIALSEELNKVMALLTSTVVEKLRSWNVAMIPKEDRRGMPCGKDDGVELWGMPSLMKNPITH